MRVNADLGASPGAAVVRRAGSSRPIGFAREEAGHDSQIHVRCGSCGAFCRRHLGWCWGVTGLGQQGLPDGYPDGYSGHNLDRHECFDCDLDGGRDRHRDISDYHYHLNHDHDSYHDDYARADHAAAVGRREYV